jgi:hypothetical protein
MTAKHDRGLGGKARPRASPGASTPPFPVHARCRRQAPRLADRSWPGPVARWVWSQSVRASVASVGCISASKVTSSSLSSRYKAIVSFQVCMWAGKVPDGFSAMRFAAFTARPVRRTSLSWLAPKVFLAQRSPVQYVLRVHLPILAACKMCIKDRHLCRGALRLRTRCDQSLRPLSYPRLPTLLSFWLRVATSPFLSFTARALLKLPLCVARSLIILVLLVTSCASCASPQQYFTDPRQTVLPPILS